MTRPARAYVAFLVICVVWSTTYLAIRIALGTIPPFPMGALRWTTAGAVLIGALRVRGEPVPPARSWGHLAVFGALLIGVANGGVLIAERTVPSGLTAVLAAVSPFWMVGLDTIMPGGDALTARRLLGLATGFLGVVLLVWPEIRLGGAEVAAGIVATQVACAGWATGSILSRRRHTTTPGENVLMTAAFEMLFGGLIFLVAATLTGQWSRTSFHPETLGALAYLTLAGSIAGFSAYAYALKHLPVSTVALYAYVNPVLAVVLGTLVLDEPFTPRIGIAATVVLAGMWLVRRSTARIKKV